MIFKKRYILGLVIIVGLTFIEVVSFTNSQNNLEYIDEKDKAYEIKENDNGQTYGSELSSKEYDNNHIF